MALAATAVSDIALNLVSPVLFWTVLALSVGWSLRRQDGAGARRDLLTVWGALILVLLAAHVGRFRAGSFGPAALTINAGLLLQLPLIGYLLRRRAVVENHGVEETTPTEVPTSAYLRVEPLQAGSRPSIHCS